jgi:hypothetical protein
VAPGEVVIISDEGLKIEVQYLNLVVQNKYIPLHKLPVGLP